MPIAVARPTPGVPDPSRVGDHAARAGLAAPAPDLLRLTLGESTRARLLQPSSTPVDVLAMRLVLLHGQQVLALPLDDLGAISF